MLSSIACLISIATTFSQGPATWPIDPNGPSVTVSPTLYGIFFEEINCSGDGGIYAEMVRNRGFENSSKPENWAMRQGSGQISIDNSVPLSSASPNALKVECNSSVSIENAGYWGYAVKAGDTYTFSMWLRGDGGSLNVSLVDPRGRSVAESKLKVSSGGWQQVTASLKGLRDETAAKLVLRFDSMGTHWIDMVSLFPTNTWKSRSNGLRSDLMVLLNEMNPAFVRFPGGCWVEGDTMALSQRWKQTVGDLQDRRTQPNIWGYMSTNGLGYHEYLQLCEDLKSVPLFVINCGMSHREVVPMDKMDEFVQDGLDAIEYANGPVTSKWGALRAKNGHPKPFGLRYLEIGNENGGPAYEERYGLMYKAIKAKYPEIELIACVWGGYPQKSPVDIIDEHYYSNPEFFVQNANRYDSYKRTGPKIYVGEYAVTQGNGNGNLKGALGEAAFMAGMERNSDVVTMSSYAPLFANVNNKAWNPDLIYFDAAKVCGTPSYYVQKMFAKNRADIALKSKIENVPVVRRTFPSGGIGIGTWNTQSEYKDIKVVQNGRVLFESADGTGLQVEEGNWTKRDGAFAQTGSAAPARAYFGDRSWRNYTLTLKARKISGVEGFMVTVGRKDKDNYLWWNLGGWGNREHGIEYAVSGGKSILGRQTPGTIETGRWYDLKVEYTDDSMMCYLDGKLIQNQALEELTPIHGVAGFNKSKTEAILKVVNISDASQNVQIDLSKTGWPAVAGTVETMTGNNIDENTLANPTKVAPRTSALGRRDARFTFTLLPRSVSILRVKRA